MVRITYGYEIMDNCHGMNSIEKEEMKPQPKSRFGKWLLRMIEKLPDN